MCWDYGQELSHPEATEVLYVQSDTLTHGYEWTSHPIFIDEDLHNGPREPVPDGEDLPASKL